MQTQAGASAALLTTVIADRSAHFRETLRRVLEQSCGASVVGEAGTLREALRIVRKAAPAVVLLDIQLVMDQPAQRLRKIAQELPGLRVIVLLDEDLPGYRRSIADRWGYDCVAKESAACELPLVLPEGAPARRASGG